MWIFLPYFPLFSMHLFYAILSGQKCRGKAFFLNRCLRIAPQEELPYEKYTFTSSVFQQHDCRIQLFYRLLYATGRRRIRQALSLSAASCGGLWQYSSGIHCGTFDYTERDIYRGLQYWADQGLIDLAFDQDGSISDLVFLEVRKPESVQQAAASVSSGVLPASAKAPVSKNAAKAASEPNDSTEAKVLSPKLKISRDRMAALQGRTGYQATPADRRILPRSQSFAD